MCKFFSFISYEREFYYCDSLVRGTEEEEPDSHSRICEIFQLREDNCNKYEVVDGKLIVDNIVDEEELLEDVQAWVDNFIVSPEFFRICKVSKQFPSITTEEQWLEVSQDSDSEVRGAVAENTNCPVNVLKILAKDSDWWVRRAVAKNVNCLANTLETLAKDSNRSVREAAAITKEGGVYGQER